jgi:hypothetical protein
MWKAESSCIDPKISCQVRIKEDRVRERERREGD